MKRIIVPPFKRGSLRGTLFFAFLLLALLPLVVISAINTWRQYESRREQVIDQLTAVATLKETGIKTWYQSLAPDLELMVANPRVRSDITQLIVTQNNEFVSNAWRGILLSTFTVARTVGHKFEEIFLLDGNGVVIVSTTHIREGQSFRSEPFFQQGLLAPFVQAPSRSATFGSVIFAAVPVHNDKNQVQGVLVGVANLDALNEIMQERAGLGDTGETYLVDGDHVILTESLDLAPRSLLTVQTQGANLALSGTNGSAFYENYRTPEVPVVGVYRWIPELQVALLTEQSQAEAFQSTIWGVQTLLVVTLIVAILTFGSAIAVSRSIATPLEGLTALATRIAGGDLTQTVQIERDDEIGTLANAFNQMTTELRELIGNLEQRVAARTHDLSALYSISAIASQPLPLDKMLAASLAQTIDAFGSVSGAVFLIDESPDQSESPRMRLVSHQGLPPGAVAELMELTHQPRFPDAVLKNPEPIVIADSSLDPRVPPWIKEMGKLSLAVMSISAEGHVVGSIGIARTNGLVFNAEELTLLQSIADKMGIEVHGDHLRQRARQATILEERQRLARELHDSVAQMLYSVMLFSEAARDAAERLDISKMDGYMNRLRETAQQALRELRLWIYDSRPQALEQEGLVGALRRRLQVVENRSGVEAQLLADGPVELPAALESELYGIAQEALNNILKHSAATRVTIQIKVADGVQLDILDNGRGFARETALERAGIGLVNMRERAERLGGTLEVHSTPGEGTSVRFHLPLAHDVPPIIPAWEILK